VWTADLSRQGPGGGILSTPALYNGVVYVMDAGRGLLAVDQKTGKLLYELHLVAGSWSSPVPINHQLLVGDCSGVLHSFDISAPRTPPEELWRLQLPGCIESTPAVWKGTIWVGTRSGAMFGIGDRF
jgi:outer membrane protein assembly factor BamB